MGKKDLDHMVDEATKFGNTLAKKAISKIQERAKIYTSFDSVDEDNDIELEDYEEVLSELYEAFMDGFHEEWDDKPNY